MSTLSFSACRVESLEALPILSRNPSRSTDRDWETASAASSLASVAEYTGNNHPTGFSRKELLGASGDAKQCTEHGSPGFQCGPKSSGGPGTSFSTFLGLTDLESGVGNIKLTGTLQGIREGEKVFTELTQGSLRRTS